jgi:hypothetical protein
LRQLCCQRPLVEFCKQIKLSLWRNANKQEKPELRASRWNKHFHFVLNARATKQEYIKRRAEQNVLANIDKRKSNDSCFPCSECKFSINSSHFHSRFVFILQNGRNGGKFDFRMNSNRFKNQRMIEQSCMIQWRFQIAIFRLSLALLCIRLRLHFSGYFQIKNIRPMYVQNKIVNCFFGQWQNKRCSKQFSFSGSINLIFREHFILLLSYANKRIESISLQSI